MLRFKRDSRKKRQLAFDRAFLRKKIWGDRKTQIWALPGKLKPLSITFIYSASALISSFAKKYRKVQN